MKRITPQAKAIADAHIAARLKGEFDYPMDARIANRDELISLVTSGKTIEALLDYIEMNFTSITSILLSRKLFHQSANYKSGVYKGFKLLIDKAPSGANL